ncbi:MAG: hypothetical protein RLZZ593_160 [Bacteroidota bacterium]|jgi:AraC-like DNA-binding protein
MSSLFDQNLLLPHRQKRTLQQLVENQTTYTSDRSELHIFETHQQAEQVELTFGFPVVASMISGKKIMHLDQHQPFEFVPGESVIMPSGDKMIIDFPEATLDAPTQCLALGIEPQMIEEVVHRFNAHTRIEQNENEWQLDEASLHLLHNQELHLLVQRLTQTYLNRNSGNAFLVDLMVQELIVRLLQTKAKKWLIDGVTPYSKDSRLSSVMQYIKLHLTDKQLDVETLANHACMSPSHFHKVFKQTMGSAPIDYLNGEKIKWAQKLMRQEPGKSVSELAYASGFNNVSYFIRKFKAQTGHTPAAFKQKSTH